MNTSSFVRIFYYPLFSINPVMIFESNTVLSSIILAGTISNLPLPINLPVKSLVSLLALSMLYCGMGSTSGLACGVLL